MKRSDYEIFRKAAIYVELGVHDFCCIAIEEACMKGSRKENALLKKFARFFKPRGIEEDHAWFEADNYWNPSMMVSLQDAHLGRSWVVNQMAKDHRVMALLMMSEICLMEEE